MNYGELLDTDFHPERISIYNYFTEYFGNPVLTKVKDSGEYSIYMGEVSVMLNREKRYLILIVLNDGKVEETQEEMKDLQWESLQTRSLYENNNVLKFKYYPRRFQPLMDKIQLIERKDTHYSYAAQTLPLTITLLPDLNGKMTYSNNGTIVTALETFATIISFNN